MTKLSPANIYTRIDALLPFSGTVTEWATKLGHANEVLVGRALHQFRTSHTTDRGKRVVTHVKAEAHGVWTIRRHNLGYAEAFSTHNK